MLVTKVSLQYTNNTFTGKKTNGYNIKENHIETFNKNQELLETMVALGLINQRNFTKAQKLINQKTKENKEKKLVEIESQKQEKIQEVLRKASEDIDSHIKNPKFAYDAKEEIYTTRDGDIQLVQYFLYEPTIDKALNYMKKYGAEKELQELIKIYENLDATTFNDILREYIEKNNMRCEYKDNTGRITKCYADGILLKNEMASAIVAIQNKLAENKS